MAESGLWAVYTALRAQKPGPYKEKTGKPSGSAVLLLVALLFGLIHQWCWWPFWSGESEGDSRMIHGNNIATTVTTVTTSGGGSGSAASGAPTDIIALSRSPCHRHPTSSSSSCYYNYNDPRPHPHPHSPSCPNPQSASYPDFCPICLPVTMSDSTRAPLLDEAERIARQFEYPTTDVLRGVKAYMDQMQEGLSKEHTSLSQIPTYVTGVPNGTEKVYSFLNRDCSTAVSFLLGTDLGRQ